MASAPRISESDDFGARLVERVRPRLITGRRRLTGWAPGRVGRQAISFTRDVGLSQVGRWSIQHAPGDGVDRLPARPPLHEWPWSEDDSELGSAAARVTATTPPAARETGSVGDPKIDALRRLLTRRSAPRKPVPPPAPARSARPPRRGLPTTVRRHGTTKAGTGTAPGQIGRRLRPEMIDAPSSPARLSATGSAGLPSGSARPARVRTPARTPAPGGPRSPAESRWPADPTSPATGPPSPADSRWPADPTSPNDPRRPVGPSAPAGGRSVDDSTSPASSRPANDPRPAPTRSTTPRPPASWDDVAALRRSIMSRRAGAAAARAPESSSPRDNPQRSANREAPPPRPPDATGSVRSAGPTQAPDPAGANRNPHIAKSPPAGPTVARHAAGNAGTPPRFRQLVRRTARSERGLATPVAESARRGADGRSDTSNAPTSVAETPQPEARPDSGASFGNADGGRPPEPVAENRAPDLSGPLLRTGDLPVAPPRSAPEPGNQPGRTVAHDAEACTRRREPAVHDSEPGLRSCGCCERHARPGFRGGFRQLVR